MSKTSEGWVFIVQHSDALHYQVVDNTQSRPRKQSKFWKGWSLMSLVQKALKVSKLIYGL